MGERTGGRRRPGKVLVGVVRVIRRAALLLIAMSTALLMSTVSDPREPTADATPSASPTTTASPVATRPDAAFLGDSYTAGVGVDPKDTWARQVARTQDWAALSFGVPGTGYLAQGKSVSGSYLDRVAGVIRADPDVVVVSGGRNDLNVDHAGIAAAAADLFGALRLGLPDAEIMVVLPWWGDGRQPAGLGRITADIRGAADAQDVTVIDTSQPLAGHGEWMLDDGVHPNPDGHAALAAAVLRSIG